LRAAADFNHRFRLDVISCGNDDFPITGVGVSSKAHHATPLHAPSPGDKTRLEELALLCSNCDRMIPARRPWLTTDDLKQIIRHRRDGAPRSLNVTS
jgi:hypothetical protein